MAQTPTKILLYDLESDIADIIKDLQTYKGAFPTLLNRLNALDVTVMNGDTKAVIQDLIDALNNDNKGSASTRLKAIEKKLIDLQNSLSNVSLNDLEVGNFNEVFTYTDGNVTKHVSTGDQAFTVIYNYKQDGSGEISTSVKTFTRENGDKVEITKTYSYTNGDITGISTATTITPAAPTV